MTDASRDEIVEVMARALAANVSAGWPRGVAVAAITALEAKGWKLVKGSHGISHGREGFDAGPPDAGHPPRDATEEEA